MLSILETPSPLCDYVEMIIWLLEMFHGHSFCISNMKNINRIQDGGQKGPPASFSSVTSANVEFSPQNFRTFSFNPFAAPV